MKTIPLAFSCTAETRTRFSHCNNTAAGVGHLDPCRLPRGAYRLPRRQCKSGTHSSQLAKFPHCSTRYLENFGCHLLRQQQSPPNRRIQIGGMHTCSSHHANAFLQDAPYTDVIPREHGRGQGRSGRRQHRTERF